MCLFESSPSTVNDELNKYMGASSLLVLLIQYDVSPWAGRAGPIQFKPSDWIAEV